MLYLYTGNLGLVFTPNSITDDGIIKDYITYGHLKTKLEPGSECVHRVPEDKLPQLFEAYLGGEQPQVTIKYQAPIHEDITKIKLMRRQYTYPKVHDDGDIILLDEDLDQGIYYHSDLTVQPFIPYFYKFFSLESSGWVSGKSAEASAMAYSGNYFGDKLFSLLPKLVKRKDVDDNFGAITTVLEEMEAFGETYNVSATAEPKGQLYRLLSLLGIELDDVKGKIDKMFNYLRDPRQATDKELPYIANNIGLNLNKEFPVDRQRNEILNHVALLKMKGTVPGFESAMRLITNIPKIETIEYGDFLMCSNNIDKLSARTITDFPWIYTDSHGNFDPYKIVNARSWSEKFNPYTFELRLYIDASNVLTSTMLSKMGRIMNNFSPVCTHGIISTIEVTIPEDVVVNVIESDVEDNVSDRYLTEDFGITMDSREYWMDTSPFSRFEINSTTASTKKINVDGDLTSELVAGNKIAISEAATYGLDGLYTVVSVTYNGPDSDILVSETIVDSTTDGYLVFGPLPVNFTNSYTSRVGFSYYLRIIGMNSTTASTKTIELPGEYESIIFPGQLIEIRNAATSGVNGYYIVNTVTYSSGPNTTDVVVNESIADSIGEGDLYHGIFESELWWDIITSVEGEETGMIQIVNTMGVT